MGPWIGPATIAVEDQRFREHQGVDPLAAVRAVGQLVREGGVVSGASTITMQVCRMTEPRERTLSAKAIESFRALQLEARCTKDEILERYLNLAPYGGNVRGVACAAERWFGKRPADLSLEEAALLAGLPQSPSRLRPDRYPARARARRDFVLSRMLAVGLLDRAQYERACAAPVVLAPRPPRATAPHVAEMAFARRPAGGRTTLDLDAQREVERIVAEGAGDLPPESDLAVVVIDIETAELRALIGSPDARDPRDGLVNGALARRSPGSTLKPFVFAAAIESGRLDPHGVVDDSPLDLAGWTPENFEGGFDGEVSVAEALRRSLNVPSLRVASRAGLHRCLGVMEGCGLRFPRGTATRSGLALVTGATEVRLFDLTNAYATLGRGGVHRPVRLFPDEPAPSRRVLTESTCEVLTGILSDAGASPFAWKTGTSSSHRDAWAVGHDGRLAIGVWIGRFGGAGRVEYTGRRVAEPLLRRLFRELPRPTPHTVMTTLPRALPVPKYRIASGTSSSG
jgi:penicillin-binding protein 1C